MILCDILCMIGYDYLMFFNYENRCVNYFFLGGKWNNTHCISINKSLFGEKNTTEANSLA